MTGLPDVGITGEDTSALEAKGDVRTLIRLLGHDDLPVRSRAADVLAGCGPSATAPLVTALDSRDSRIRLGAAYALGFHHDPGTLRILIRCARADKSTEVRLAALLALAERNDPSSMQTFLESMTDPDRCVRYGAAVSLKKIGWKAGDDADKARYAIALQDWVAVSQLGAVAAGPLRGMLKDNDPATRIQIIGLLSRAGTGEAAEGCARALQDSRDTVRYQGLLLAIRCGISADRLPLLLARRERTGPDPAAAALLNFLFLGIGYNYLGKWWGFLLFMTYMSILVLAQLQAGPLLPYLFAYPITAIFAVQTYFMAKKIADTSGVGS